MNIPMKLHEQNVSRRPKGQAWAPRWWGVLLIGLLLWAATAADVFLTGNLIVLPSVALLGSFLVPVTARVGRLGSHHNPSFPARWSLSVLTTALLTSGAARP